MYRTHFCGNFSSANSPVPVWGSTFPPRIVTASAARSTVKDPGMTPNDFSECDLH